MPRARASPSKRPTPNSAALAASKNGPQSPSREETMKLDFSNVSLVPAPREAGDYEGELVGHVLNLASKNSGQPTLRLDFSDAEAPTKLMFGNYSLQPQALWKIKRDLIRLGASVEEMNSPSADIEAIVTALYGYRATLQYGDPRDGTDADGNPRKYDNYLGLKDPKDK